MVQNDNEGTSYSYEANLEDKLEVTKDQVGICFSVVDYILKFPDTKHYPVNFDELNLGAYAIEKTKKTLLDHKIGIMFGLACFDEIIGPNLMRGTFGLVGIDLPVMTSFYLGMGLLTSPITDKIVNYFIDLHFQNKTFRGQVKEKANHIWNREYRKK